MNQIEKKFYRDNELLKESHTNMIEQMRGNRNKDNEYFNHLVKACFQKFVTSTAQKISINDIDVDTSVNNPARKFIVDDTQLSSLFINDYYQLPKMNELNIVTRQEKYKDEPLENDELVEEFHRNLYNPKGMAVLIGNVGEGKSVFLSKLASELKSKKYSNDELAYIPITIDVQAFFNGINKHDNVKGDIKNFWEYVQEIIVSYIEKPYRSQLNNFISETKSGLSIDNQLEIAVNFNLFKILNINGTSQISSNTDEETEETYNSTVFNKLRKLSNELDSQNHRIVLIFDNLDTFYYEHERYMFFDKGKDRFEEKINLLKKIYSDVKHEFLKNNDSSMSFVFTARPYAYEQIFSTHVNSAKDKPNFSLYKLDEVDSEVVINKRLEMLGDLIKHINSKDLKGGKKEALNKNYKIFNKHLETLNKQMSNSKNSLFKKFHKIANQGYRSIMHFYQQYLFYSGTRNFGSFFNHNILYLYMLDMYESYSQVTPLRATVKKEAYFPNIFLLRGDADCNVEYKELCQQKHKPVYFLKYLILLAIKNKISNVEDLFEYFSSYEDSLFRLALGSLSTVNEQNCIQLNFSGRETIAVDDFIKTITSTLTTRGEVLLENNYCFSFECLQLYFDDYLLMRPRVEFLKGLPIEIAKIIKPSSQAPSYSYMLHSDLDFYTKSRVETIFIKTKQSLILLSILEAAKKFEQKKYEDTWNKLESTIDVKNTIFEKDFFIKEKNNVLKESFRTLASTNSEARVDALKQFNALLNEHQYIFDDFYYGLLMEKNGE